MIFYFIFLRVGFENKIKPSRLKVCCSCPLSPIKDEEFSPTSVIDKRQNCGMISYFFKYDKFLLLLLMM